MKNRWVSWLLLCVALIVLSCEGPRGAAGPAGTANVIYSEWYSPVTWDPQIIFGVYERTFTMTTPALTQDIIDNGVVLVYMRFVGLAPEISQLPVSLEDVDYNFTFRAQSGSIKVVYWRYTNPGVDPGVIPSENLVRYVLIPGGVLDDAALSRGITSTQLTGSLDSMPYREVCGMLDIPE